MLERSAWLFAYVDGGFSTKEDIQSVGQRGVTVFAPVKERKKQEQQGKDPYAAKPGGTPEVAAWRERMGTEEAKEKYRQRCKTEWPNAVCRNRGLQQFLVRGLEKVKSVVLWHVLIHNWTFANLRVIGVCTPSFGAKNANFRLFVSE